MGDQSERDAMIEAGWRDYLTTGDYAKERKLRKVFRLMPGSPRCKNCYAPFHGVGAPIARAIYHRQPSNLNPLLCNACERYADEYQGGAEIELSLLFGDVRGSTTLAEKMSPTEYSQLINRFYAEATKVMVWSDALIDKIIGDQVAGMYVPGFAGSAHARVAIEAAQGMLRATGHDDPNGPWIPIGIGVHTGIAFVGAVHSDEGMTDITVLGDAPNTAARLSSTAARGEILVSEAAAMASELEVGELESRTLELKGKTEHVTVYVLTDLHALPGTVSA